MQRYIPNTPEQREEMLRAVGVRSTDDLFSDIPRELRLKDAMRLPPALSETELSRLMKGMAAENANAESSVCFLGAGAYDHFVPSVVNHMTLRQEFFTSYTPYQPELSQGTLRVIFEFQTMICALTGMDVANASMYDGATAAAEAALLAASATKRQEVLVSRAVHPDTRRVLETYLPCRNVRLREFGQKNGVSDVDTLKSVIGSDTAAVLVQNPNFFGSLEDLAAIGDIARGSKAMFIAATNPISLALLEPPASFGADIVTGEGQPLGNGMNFGGPGFGYFAVTEKLMRKLPGRVVGQTKDRDGKTAYVLTLQAREQHIRREKATSNICSNHNLCILMATVYMSLLGKQGLREVAGQCLQKAHYARKALVDNGFTPLFDAPFFNEFAVRTTEPAGVLNSRLSGEGFIGGYDLSREYPELSGGYLVAVTERRTKDEIDRFAACAGRGKKA